MATGTSNGTGTCPFFPFSRPEGDVPSGEYERLRQQGPLARVTLWDGSQPWLVVQNKAVREVLAEGDGSNVWSKDRRLPQFPELSAAWKAAPTAEPTFVYLDEPERARDREIIDRVFSRDAIQEKWPNLIHNIVEGLLGSLKEHMRNGPVDFYDLFAARVPTYTIYSLLGASSGDLSDLHSWHEARMKNASTPTEPSDAAEKLLGYLSEMIDRCLDSPRDDAISDIATNEILLGHLDKAAALRVLTPMLVTATISHLLCYGVIILDQRPDLREAIKSDLSLIKAFVSELCRFHTSSAVANGRVAIRDTVINGQNIRKGEAILLSLQSANRDSAAFPNPNEFNVHRDADDLNLAFGYGPRRCPVEWLAIEQLEVGFKLLLQQVPDIKLAIPFDQIKWLPVNAVVGVTELPVVQQR